MWQLKEYFNRCLNWTEVSGITKRHIKRNDVSKRSVFIYVILSQIYFELTQYLRAFVFVSTWIKDNKSHQGNYIVDAKEGKKYLETHVIRIKIFVIINTSVVLLFGKEALLGNYFLIPNQANVLLLMCSWNTWLTYLMANVLISCFHLCNAFKKHLCS